jgi:hypothetical protein
LLFGRLDERAYQRNRRRFLADVETAFSELFQVHPGRVLPGVGEELERSFDFVVLVIEFVDFRLRLIRGRGELRTQIAPIPDPDDWLDISLLWHLIQSKRWSVPPSAQDNLTDTVHRLRDCWNEIVAALPSEIDEEQNPAF